MFLRMPVFTHPTIPTREIQRINIRIKHDVVEMPDDDGPTRKDGLVVVNGQSHVHRPAASAGQTPPCAKRRTIA